MHNHEWRDELYRQWMVSQCQGFPVEVVQALQRLGPSQAAEWIMGFKRAPAPVARAISSWCLEGQARRWRLAPGGKWALWPTASEVWIAYPEPLSQDPLTMCGMSLMWAEQVVGDPSFAALRLGPLLAPAAYHAEMAGEWIAPVLRSWLDAYQALALGEGLGNVVEWAQDVSSGVRVPWAWPWPPWPEEAGRYARHFRRGVVPHDVRGRAPAAMTAVLLGLASLAPEDGLSTLTLAHKAIQSVRLSAKWQEHASRED